MDIKTTVEMMNALGHESRLKVFRLLVRAGPAGLSAGRVGERLKIRQNTMSTHLQILTRAKLLQRKRSGREIFYKVDFNVVSRLMTYLVKDCCKEAPQVMEPLMNITTCKKGACV